MMQEPVILPDCEVPPLPSQSQPRRCYRFEHKPSFLIQFVRVTGRFLPAIAVVAVLGLIFLLGPWR